MTFEMTEEQRAEDKRLAKKNADMLAAIRQRNQARTGSTTASTPVHDTGYTNDCDTSSSSSCDSSSF